MKQLVAVLVLLFSFSAFAEGDKAYDKEFNYHEVIPAVPTSVAEGKVEVVELFWYGCPHCFRFEPALEEWHKRKADYIEFVRVPAVLNPRWGVHAQAYYAAELLGVEEKMHPLIFQAIHEQRRRLNNERSLARFFAMHGVNEDDFRKAFNSLAVDTKLKRAAELGRSYQVTGVPSVIINGKYRSSASVAGSYEDLTALIDQVAAEEYAAMNPANPEPAAD